MEPTQNPYKILLVEDNEINQMLAQHLLAKIGHTVVTANNGLEAIQLHEDDHFDMILMDVQMPEMDGLEATRIIRTREKETGQHIPILALTAFAMASDRELVFEAGMDDYLTKPIDRDLLLITIEKNAGTR